MTRATSFAVFLAGHPGPSKLTAVLEFPGPVEGPELIETHISWVLLAGEHAYKVKRPVRFSFLDFSSLERRRRACMAELRLNRRFAPDLYEALVPIRRIAGGFGIGGDAGEIVEWAVQMRRFPGQDEATQLLASGRLDPSELERFGAGLARIQERLPAVRARSRRGDPASLQRPAIQNFVDMAPFADAHEAAILGRLRRWTRERYPELRRLLRRRKESGCIREGHGDLHLGNLVRWRGTLTPFDGIEFSAELRWIDVLAEASFLFMDLLRCGRPDLAYRFLDGWLDAGGGYEGLPLLPYYAVYRALVRAKVAMIRRAADASPRNVREVQAHLDLAERLARPRQPFIVAMHGYSGSGKTWLGSQLLAHLPAIRVRSDVERKRLHDLPAAAASASPVGGGLYAAAASARTYERMFQVAEAAIAGGESVIVDAAFLARAQRTALAALAQRLRVPLVLVDCQAPAAVLRRRVADRVGRGDASEADPEVLEHQLAHAEAIDADEGIEIVTVDTQAAIDVDLLCRTLRGRATSAATAALSDVGDSIAAERLLDSVLFRER